MQRLLTIAFGAVFVMLMIASQFDAKDKPATDSASTSEESEAHAAEPQRKQQASSSKHNAWVDQTEITRDSSGQFHTEARINGQATAFLVDTGADLVALTTTDAQRLGMVVDRSSFRPVGRSASGTAMGMPVTIERLEVAGQEIDGVNAVILDGLQTNLLGQSVLRKLGKVELQGDKMVISRR